MSSEPRGAGTPGGDEQIADRAIRRAEDLLQRLGLPAPPPPGGPGPPPPPTPPMPSPTAGDLWVAVRTAPSMLGRYAVVARLLAIATALSCVVVWLATGAGMFWPVWVAFGFAAAFGVDAAVAKGLQVREPAARAFALHLWLTAYTAALLVTIWLLDGPGRFWPAWPLVVLGLVLLAHALTTPAEPFARKQELAARVDELTRTRSGVLDVQAAELRRIERDLHDGAQARLVALSMQLGRAEHRLGADADPELLALVQGAQEEARQAIAELRDLSRGIAPPLLVDRGLVAAVEAQAQRSPLDVEVDAAGLGQRLPAVVESAAYFVVSEALTNAAKHAGAGASVQVQLRVDGQWLRLSVADDGAGGADPAGSGLSGLRGRVEALDGRLWVMSPTGEGTRIVAELPCGS